ncbi:MAG: GntR family transcriptional regulator [Turicibacter sp.]
MKKVDKNIKTPLHVQLSAIIKEMIESGELLEGNSIMPEREICKLQAVSRMTVNKAILNLVNEGLLDRQQGRGTYVSYKKKKHSYQKLEGLTDMMTKKGLCVKNELLSFNLDRQSNQVRKKLNLLENDTLIYEVKRIRFVDQEPFILETVYINENMCQGLTESLVLENSLYQLYRDQFSHTTKRAEQIISPVIITDEQARLLKNEKDSLALKIDRVVYTDEDKIMEYTSSIFMTDKHEFEIILHNY